MKKLSILFILIIVFGTTTTFAQQSGKPYVVMLSMDGFRWDYTDDVSTPNFDKIAALGVKATSLKPSFPTKTFPNHYSIATGLYPDYHGIVLNSFFDPETARYYAIANREAVEDGSFYGGEPIWVTAEKQGVIAGSYFWVGSEAKINGYRPTYWKIYDEKTTYSQRIDSVVAWLQKPDTIRPHLVLWYFEEPDHCGHEFGPGSTEIKKKVAELDSLLGVFMDKIEKLPIASQLNIIVTSDHGMGTVSDKKKVVIYDHVPEKWIAEIQGYNPNFNIKARDGYIDSIFLALKNLDGIKIWKSKEVPDRLHYGTNPRTLDLVVVADSSWSLVETPDKKVGRGAHGYDTNDADMHAIFYAYGPAFKKNYISPTFENVDIYPLICKILGLKPARVDGRLKNVSNMLRNF